MVGVTKLNSNLGAKITKLGTFTASGSDARPPSYVTKTYDISSYGNITTDNVFITFENIYFQASVTASGLGENVVGYVSKSISGTTLTVKIPTWIQTYNGYIYVKPTVSVYIVK